MEVALKYNPQDFKKLNRFLKKFPEPLQLDAVAHGMYAAAQAAVPYVVAAIPVGNVTGRMRNSVRAEYTGYPVTTGSIRSKRRRASARITMNQPGGWVEFGTRQRYTTQGFYRGRMVPRPFFFAAVKRARPAMMAAAVRVIKSRLPVAVRKAKR